MKSNKEIKPLEIDLKYGRIITFLGILVAIVTFSSTWKDVIEWIAPDGNLLNWNFVFVLVIFVAVFVWYFMNLLWLKEYNAHDLAKKDKENLESELKISENERLTDVITGVPNIRSLEKDISKYFSRLITNEKKVQFIFIDLKDFKAINDRLKYRKTNELLRILAQTIYKKMRRNEDMYKFPEDGQNQNDGKRNFYRIFPGGDEFVFIIEGDQAEAIGFTNRLVNQFEQVSAKIRELFKEDINLTFYCSIVEMDARDTFDDVFKKAEDCYKIAKESTERYSVCWYPNNRESVLSKDDRKKLEYEKIRKVFDVMTIEDKEYDIK